MPLEEPDIATAGTGEPDHDGVRSREQQVARFASTVLLVILATAAVVAITWGPDRSFRERPTATRRDDRREAAVPGATIETRTTSTTTTSTTIIAGPAPAPTVPAPASTGGPRSPLPPVSAPPAPQALPPGVPGVSMGPAGPGGCTASWTVADGGAPIIEYRVTHESAAVPPGPAGLDIGGAIRIDRTTATTATVDTGATIRMSASNAIGDGPTSEPYRCN